MRESCRGAVDGTASTVSTAMGPRVRHQAHGMGRNAPLQRSRITNHASRTLRDGLLASSLSQSPARRFTEQLHGFYGKHPASCWIDNFLHGIPQLFTWDGSTILPETEKADRSLSAPAGLCGSVVGLLSGSGGVRSSCWHRWFASSGRFLTRSRHSRNLSGCSFSLPSRNCWRHCWRGGHGVGWFPKRSRSEMPSGWLTGDGWTKRRLRTWWPLSQSRLSLQFQNRCESRCR